MIGFPSIAMPKCAFLALPVELMEEILTLLHPSTILRVRQTCRFLCSTTKSRSLWHRLVRDLQAHPSISRIEEPVNDYTTDELEHWLLRRHRVRAAWTHSHRPLLRKRSVQYPARYPLLVPGGRWLLSMYEDTTSLVATDLDAAQLMPSVLCAAGGPSDQGQEISQWSCFTIWINPSEPRLTFRVAIFAVTESPGSDCITVYQVRLTGHGRNAKLSAQKLVVLPTKFPGRSHSEALDNRYFIQVKGIDHNGKRNELSVMHIFPYDAALGSSNRGPISMKMDRKGALDMCILPHERVAITRRTEIAIYPIPEESRSVTSEKRLAALYTLPLSISSSDCLTGFRAPFHFGRTSTSTVYLDSANQLFFLIIPHDSSQEPYVSRTASKSIYTAQFYGSWKAVGFSNTIAVQNGYSWNPVVRLGVTTYSLDLEHQSSRIAEFPAIYRREIQLASDEQSTFHQIRAFDEGQGRLVCGTKFGTGLEIYDIVY